jgi:hypothetical protein
MPMLAQCDKEGCEVSRDLALPFGPDETWVEVQIINGYGATFKRFCSVAHAGDCFDAMLAEDVPVSPVVPEPEPAPEPEGEG